MEVLSLYLGARGLPVLRGYGWFVQIRRPAVQSVPFWAYSSEWCWGGRDGKEVQVLARWLNDERTKGQSNLLARRKIEERNATLHQAIFQLGRVGTTAGLANGPLEAT